MRPSTVLAAVSGAALLAYATPGAGAAQDAERGRTVYERWCVACHGVEGRGDGPAAEHMLPRPRDFVQARYQVRTTGPGELPTDEDLRRILRDGMPGTAMPGWPNLSERERDDLIAYLKQFSPFFEDGPPSPMEFSRDPGAGEGALASGIEVYEKLECWKCHGSSGRGDGQSSPTLEDWRDHPIRAADLTEPWTFNGGMGPDAIHARFLTGLDGTPMPAYSDALAAGVVTEEELWNLAHYVASLGPDEAPEVSELILAVRQEGELPAAPDDETWAGAQAFYVPLVGQVIEKPRQFAPTVDGVWVQALHDGNELAVRLMWNDPSRSPDPAWDEWQARMRLTLYSDAEPAPAAGSEAEPAAGGAAGSGAAGSGAAGEVGLGAEVDAALATDGAAAAASQRWADGLAVQFPPQIPEGSERPYFLMGDARRPVSMWVWDSDTGLRAATGRGLGAIEVLGAGSLAGEATFEEGQWRLVVRRPLAGEDAAALSFREGVAIPIGFFAWDGSSGEDMRRGSVSGWYYIYLEAPRSAAVYTVPLVAALLTAGFAMLLAARARRKSQPTVEMAAQVT